MITVHEAQDMLNACEMKVHELENELRSLQNLGSVGQKGVRLPLSSVSAYISQFEHLEKRARKLRSDIAYFKSQPQVDEAVETTVRELVSAILQD